MKDQLFIYDNNLTNYVIVIVIIYSLMQKSHINFKQIRKKVTYVKPDLQQQDPLVINQNIENIPINPTHKISFRGIKKNLNHHQCNNPQSFTTRANGDTKDINSQLQEQNIFKYVQIQEKQNQGKDNNYQSPRKLNTDRTPQASNLSQISFSNFAYALPNSTKNGNKNIINSKTSKVDSSREECNKFSILIESKGYNSNCNSGRKKSSQISFRNLNNSSNSNSDLMNNSSKYRINTQRNERQTKKTEVREQTGKQTKQKQYLSSKPTACQISSLNKLKNRIISPLKKKSESTPEPQIKVFDKQKQRQRDKINIFEHESILSQHDLVNMSKTNQSLDFDMSPYL